MTGRTEPTLDMTSPGQWHRRHLLAIEPLSREEILTVLDVAAAMKEISQRDVKKVPALRGKTVVLLFFEPSTRTRTSFEIAAKRLSADTVSFSVSTSSVSKGETFLDTVLNIQAMAPDAIVVRHRSAGAPYFITNYIDACVINAGDGSHEHPTQALLDAMTVRERLGRLDGLKVAIVGDILHSRVARSNVFLWHKMGSEVWVCGPPTLLPPVFRQWPVRVTYRLEEALEGADVIMVLRLQLERHISLRFPSIREYFQRYGLTRERLKYAKEGVLIMHPGPMNRGIEIESEVADGPYSVILYQVANGIAVRMAVLYLLLGGATG